VIQLTDLNLAEGINLVLAGDEERVTRLDQLEWGANWNKLVKVLKKEKKNDSFLLMAKYTPHRVLPDRLTPKRNGKDRFHAVTTGAFHMYPNNCPQYYDALEVRFAHEKGMSHEKWLDFGPTETIAYVKNAAALGATTRLSPPILAQVDPQAFWSAILHYYKFLATLKECCSSDTKLVKEWADLLKGFNKRVTGMRKIESDTGLELLENDEGEWVIANDREHAFISLRNAQVAFQLLYENADKMGNSIDLLEEYRDTQIERDVFALAKTVNESQDWNDMGRVLLLITMGMPANALDVCEGCGKTTGLSLCGRCQCFSYCGRKCQKDCFKSHKKICSKISGEPNFKARLYMPRSTLPTKPSMFSEVSGIGKASIFWSAASPNVVMYGNDYASDKGEKVKFNDLKELDPLMRFLLTCGPLTSLAIAKSSVDEAMRMVGGDPSQLRMPGAGFTALEWAAKKGNKSTVSWLCKDPRTKALVRVGSPVGWAAYTGQTEIMRLLVTVGADPAATDAVLWSFQPPLLVAASNGKCESMKYLVEECGQDIGMKNPRGEGVLDSVEEAPNWRELDDHKKTHKWAKKRLASRS
jgi:hypothetical protein